jgi:hypothetical protein
MQNEENYTNADPCTTSIGSIIAGDTFSNKTMSEMLTSILYSYQLPAFTMLTIDSQNAIIEVGDVIAKNPLFLWSTSNPTNITVNSLSIKNISDNVTLATGIANDGTEQITATAIQLVTNISKIFRIQATNTNSAIFYRDFTVTGQYRLYYGESTDATLIESTIKTLRANLLTSQIQNTFVMYGGGYKYICYESTLGTLTSFKDAATNLNVPFETSYLVALTNTFGITKNYRVHRTTNILGSDINIIAN